MPPLKLTVPIQSFDDCRTFFYYIYKYKGSQANRFRQNMREIIMRGDGYKELTMYFLKKQLKARLGQAGREKEKADNLKVERRSFYGYADLTSYNALKIIENKKFTYDDIKLK